MKLQRHRMLYVFAISLWAITLISKLRYNGLVFGFDYSLYQPDGALYSVRTLRFLGRDQIDAVREVTNWYAMKSPHLLTEVTNNLQSDSHLWGVASTRIIYPLFSTPFVSLFGLSGMLVLPAISYLTLMLITIKISRKCQTEFLGVGILLILTFSTTFNRWMIINYTDALLTALFSVTSYILLISRKPRQLFFSILILIIISSFTRFCLPFWVCLLLSIQGKLNNKHKFILITAAALSSIPSFVTTKNALLPNFTHFGTVEKIVLLPFNFIWTFWIEFIQLLLLDRALLILVTLGVTISILNRDHQISKYFISMFIGAISLTAINGVQGVNFRYQLPIIPFIIVLLLNKELAKKIEASVRNSIRAT